MNLGLTPLLNRIAADPEQSFILVSVIQTLGSTYRKPGSMMLLDQAGQMFGLVSGGCLEADLQAQAQPVWETGEPCIVTYDLREDDDTLWGLGLGCQGLVRLLLERVDAGNAFGGLGLIKPYWLAGRHCLLIKVIEAGETLPLARHWLLEEADQQTLPIASEQLQTIQKTTELSLAEANLLAISVQPAPRLLICGAGPDVAPLVKLANACDWRVTVYDHRPAYALEAHFPGAEQVICEPAEALVTHTGIDFDAAVVMSHHLPSDAKYVQQLGASKVAYIGLLGPVARREQLLAETGFIGDARFYGPAGLDIGADLPETIALSILAEAHTVLNSGDGGFLSGSE